MVHLHVAIVVAMRVACPVAALLSPVAVAAAVSLVVVQVQRQNTGPGRNTIVIVVVVVVLQRIRRRLGQVEAVCAVGSTRAHAQH